MKYSIITPVYNREDCVARCIESVLNQKKSVLSQWEYEHIIVDDGSADRTSEIITSYANQSDKIIFIKFSANRGTNAARNAAIAKATGDFCIILDSDDYFLENALDTIDSCIQKKKVFLHYMFTPNDRKDEFDKSDFLKNEQVITYQDMLSQKYTGDFIHVIKTEILQEFPFDESLRIYEGTFFLRFYREAKNICFINKLITIRERGRNDSVSREYIKTNCAAIEKASQACSVNIEWFKDDYLQFGLLKILRAKYFQLLHNYLLLGDYVNCKKVLLELKPLDIKIPFIYRMIYKLRLAKLYYLAFVIYQIIKYNFLNGLK